MPARLIEGLDVTWFLAAPVQISPFFLLFQHEYWEYPCSLFSLSVGFSIRAKATFILFLLGLLPAIYQFLLASKISCLEQQKKLGFIHFWCHFLPPWMNVREGKGDVQPDSPLWQTEHRCWPACKEREILWSSERFLVVIQGQSHDLYQIFVTGFAPSFISLNHPIYSLVSRFVHFDKLKGLVTILCGLYGLAALSLLSAPSRFFAPEMEKTILFQAWLFLSPRCPGHVIPHGIIVAEDTWSPSIPARRSCAGCRLDAGRREPC